MLTTDPASLPPLPEPKFATQRESGLWTIGPAQANFAERRLGRPLLRWQRMVLDVMGERVDGPGSRPRYGTTVVTVQRQAGKTDVMLVSASQQCSIRADFQHGHTAQTGADAQDQFLKFDRLVVQRSPLKPFVHVRRGNGHCDMTFPLGGVIAPKPPTEQKGHGNQYDLYDIDEAWAFTSEEGAALLQAIGPTQLTRPDPQIRIWSAGGTATSTWLAELVARGRAKDPTICYFEWGIPDDLALDDYAAIASYHPAFGELVDQAAIAKLADDLNADKDPAGFARAAGNRWTEVIGGVIPDALWKSVRCPDPVPKDTPIGFGAARSQDGTQVAIVSAVLDGDRIIVEVCDILPSAWRAAEHVEAWAGTDALGVGKSGASSALFDDLVTRDNCEPIGLGGRDASAACAQLLDALPHKAIVFRGHPDLDAAVKIAGKRNIDGGGWVWAHTGQGQIAVLEAATYAVWALAHRPAPVTGVPDFRL